MLLRKLLSAALVFILLLPKSGFAAENAEKTVSAQEVTDVSAAQFLKIKEQGGRFEDMNGKELSVTRIAAGQVSQFVYIPASNPNDLKYQYKIAQKNQSLTVAVLKANQRIAARKFELDRAKSTEENLVQLRQAQQSLESEVAKSVAFNSTSAEGRSLASSQFDVFWLTMMFLNAYFCLQGTGLSALNCGVAAAILLSGAYLEK